MFKNRTLRKILILIFWLALWQIAAVLIHNVILLAGPFEVICCLLRLCVSARFWYSIFTSLIHIAAGFICGSLSGILLGILAYRFSLVDEFLWPVVSLIKAIPVASFVILALIWVGSENLSMLIAYLIAFPSIYISTKSGLESTDVKLLEMARVFQIGFLDRVRFIYLPALIPYLCSACETAVGMSWKGGIAAEVIGIPAHSVGERLYMAKIYLETGDVFAWTFVIILLSVGMERLILALLARLKGV